MTGPDFRAWLMGRSACAEAMTWLDAQPEQDLAAIWATCPRADWLLWLCRYTDIDRKTLVRTAVECAALALPYTTDLRVSACIDATRGWVEGTVSDEDLLEKRSAADDAAYAAHSTSAAADAAAAAAADAAAERKWQTTHLLQCLRGGPNP